MSDPGAAAADGRAQPLAVVVLISGRGSNMQALIEASRDPALRFRVARVFSDKASAPGLEAARRLGVPAEALVAAGRERADFDRELAERIEREQPALIAMAGFMRILSAPFIERFAGRMLNIHPSLLPRYPGLRTHARALAAGDREHGATVHFVTETLDGGPAVLQARVPVRADDDEARLAARVLACEHRIYPLAVRWFCEGRLRQHAGRAWFDGAPLDAPLQYEDLRPCA